MENVVLAGTPWRIVSVSRRSARLDPPEAYWAVYRLRLTDQPDEATAVADDDDEEEATPFVPGAHHKELRLVARAVFDTDMWTDYRASIAEAFDGATFDPLDGLGNPVVFDETQHVFWFFPVDPELPTLTDAANPTRVLRLMRDHKRDILARDARITDVDVSLARYMPERSCILRYDLHTEPPSARQVVYGKVQRHHRGRKTDEVMRSIWEVAQASDGRLDVPRPLGYYEDLELFLQGAVPGEPVGSDRTQPLFMDCALAAADALAVIHDADLSADDEAEIEDELGQLDGVVEQFALVHPPAFQLLRQLLTHIRSRVRKTPTEELLATHGDFKYDQFLYHDGHFRLIDFDYYTTAENSYDISRYCAHITPSMPDSWEETAAAEEARSAFLARYRELRPDATLERFPMYEATHLAIRSMVLMWTQMSGWEAAAESLLVLGMERLQTPAP